MDLKKNVDNANGIRKRSAKLILVLVVNSIFTTKTEVNLVTIFKRLASMI